MGKKRKKKWSNHGPQPFRHSQEKPLKMQLRKEQGIFEVPGSVTVVTVERRGRVNSVTEVQATLARTKHINGGFGLNRKKVIRGADGTGIKVTS